MKLSQLHKNTIINASKSVIMSLCTHILIDINYILGPRIFKLGHDNEYVKVDS